MWPYVALALGALLLPVVSTPMPPLLDYPSHFARMWLLAGGMEVAPLDGMFRADWSGAWTNVGIDILAATLGRVLGLWVLGPATVGAAVLLPALGIVLLNRAVFGGWHWWQAGFAVLAWNSTVLAGFLNFQIGVGLAFVAAALEPSLWRGVAASGPNQAGRGVGGSRALLMRVAAAAALLAWHPFATGLYGVLLAASGFGDGRWADVRASFGRRVARGMGRAGPATVLPVGAYLLLSSNLPIGHDPARPFDIWDLYSFETKVATFMSAISTYDRRLDVAAVALLWVAARVVASGPLFRVHAGLGLAAVGMLMLALVVPSVLADAVYVDWRFSIMGLLTLAAAVRPEVATVRQGRGLAMALMVLGVARSLWIADVWRERQADISALQDVLAAVPAGAAVLPVQHGWRLEAEMPRGRLLAIGVPTYLNLAAWAVPLRHAFVPTLFATPGKQPLRIRPPWSDITASGEALADVARMHEAEAVTGADHEAGYVTRWRERFGYVLVLNAQQPDATDEASIQELELMRDTGFLRLYRVRGGP